MGKPCACGFVWSDEATGRGMVGKNRRHDGYVYTKEVVRRGRCSRRLEDAWQEAEREAANDDMRRWRGGGHGLGEGAMGSGREHATAKL